MFEDTITFDEDNAWYSENEIVLVEGESYTVTWNGVEYTCTAGNEEGVIFIGNISIFQEEGNGVPFIFMYPNLAIREEEGLGFCCASVYGETEANVSIVCKAVKKIDNKYIDVDSLPKKIGEELLIDNLTVKNGDDIKDLALSKFDEGCSYIVYIDDTKYEVDLKCYTGDGTKEWIGVMYIGENLESLFSSDNYTTYPFCIFHLLHYSQIFFSDENEHKLTLYKSTYSKLPICMTNYQDAHKEITLYDGENREMEIRHDCYHLLIRPENFEEGITIDLSEMYKITERKGYTLIESGYGLRLQDPCVVYSVTSPTDDNDKYMLDCNNYGLKESFDLRKQIVIEMDGSYYYPTAIHIGEDTSSVEICDHGTFIEIYTKE